MDSETRLDKFLGSVSKDKFRINANKLLNECFILKGCTDTKNCYYFILKEKELFIAYDTSYPSAYFYRGKEKAVSDRKCDRIC